jgi:flavin-binding protein dodecin
LCVEEESEMPDHVYKTVEITGSSSTGIEEAIKNAVAKAVSTLRHLDWFEVAGIRGSFDESGIEYYQVTLKIGFRLE